MSARVDLDQAVPFSFWSLYCRSINCRFHLLRKFRCQNQKQLIFYGRYGPPILSLYSPQRLHYHICTIIANIRKNRIIIYKQNNISKLITTTDLSSSGTSVCISLTTVTPDPGSSKVIRTCNNHHQRCIRKKPPFSIRYIYV